MKKNSVHKKRFSLLDCAALLSIALSSAVARATPVYDREFTLERVGALKPWDNADQAFADLVREAYGEYFGDHSRFRYQDVSKTDTVLTKSKIAYDKVIEDKQVLQQVGRSLKLNSLIRTKVFKQSGFYEVQIDWINLPRADLLTSENFTIQEPTAGLVGFPERFKSEIKAGVERMLKRFPFIGQVTGRDDDWITVALGSADGVSKGDTFVISTIEEVKRHPLLDKVVDWRFDRIGALKVEDVDRHLSFCKVMEQEPGKEFAPLQKVTALIPGEDRSKLASTRAPEEPSTESRYERPRTGWVAGGIGLGVHNRSYQNPATGLGQDGSGFNILARGESQIWLTKHWFAEIALYQGFFGYSQKDLATGVTSTGVGSSGTMTRFRINGGYTFFATPDFFGPRGWVKLGYGRTSYSMTSNAAESLSSMSFGGLFLGVGGDLPLRPRWGVMAEIDFAVFKAATEELALSGTVTGVTDTLFYIGGYYWFHSRLKLNFGLELITHGADFISNNQVTHRSITFVPAIQYYF